jgi:hypothetical protein
MTGSQPHRTLFAHLGRSLVQVFVQPTGSNVAVGMRTGEDVAPPAWVLGIGAEGWPRASHSILVLSHPARDLLPDDHDEVLARAAISLAVVAWNLPIFEEPGADWAGDLREDILEAARRIPALDPDTRAVFAEMLAVRRTRFAYDPRAIQVLSVQVEGENIRVQAVAMTPAEGAFS